ncbi:hypothetical protein MTO96_010322 [Rhipicephalus appendiculatus]
MHREAALVLVLFALKISQLASGLRGPGVCESLVRALGPDARSLRPYLQRHMAVPGVAMRRDLFECLLAELPRWPAQQLGADLGRVAQLAERATPADGPAQAQMLRLLWSAPAQGLPEDVVRRARAAGRALLGRASMPDTVVRRYEALFEDGRSSAEARDVARLLAEHAFDCRHAPPGDSELDRLPVTSARHALAILSHFARSRSCAGSTLVPLPDEASSGQLVWQAASLFDHGYPKSLGLQESEAADYSRARTLEKERAYNDMLRFVRESMKNASLSSLSLELLLKIGIDVASNCQPPGSTVSLLRSIIFELQRRGGVSPENNRVFSHLLTSFQASEELLQEETPRESSTTSTTTETPEVYNSTTTTTEYTTAWTSRETPSESYTTGTTTSKRDSIGNVFDCNDFTRDSFRRLHDKHYEFQRDTIGNVLDCNNFKRDSFRKLLDRHHDFTRDCLRKLFDKHYDFIRDSIGNVLDCNNFKRDSFRKLLDRHHDFKRDSIGDVLDCNDIYVDGDSFRTLFNSNHDIDNREESKYPRSIQYIIASLLKKTPVQPSNIPKSGMTPLSYVHWPTYQLPPDLVDNIAKEVEDRDYKITHLTKELSFDLVSPALDPTVRATTSRHSRRSYTGSLVVAKK